MHLVPPKTLNWSWNLSQAYQCPKRRLITSGCSFTASTQQTESAASWPGFVRDRCRFEEAVDMSYPGMGNDYIRQSIMDYVSDDCLVIVMWSGLDRVAQSMSPPKAKPIGIISQQEKHQRIMKSFEMIQQLSYDLKQRNIPHAFTQYVNLIYPPFLPVRDTTPTWDQALDSAQLKTVATLIDIPTNSRDFLYDYAFFNNHLTQGDQFHPPVECNLTWTDTVLLPALANKGLISKI